MNSHNLFNKTYYEDGVRNGVSGYQDYHWMPTRSYPEAIEIVNRIDFNTCIDYGCAKGFLVHALRMLGKQAFGEDMSDYAIENCHPRVKQYVSKPTDRKVDLIICKDVLEHVYENQIFDLLSSFWMRANKFLFVIPLGDNDLFRIREYEIDITHVTKKNEDWWLDQFRLCGFELKHFSYSMGAIKEKWIPANPYGNGFFILEK